EGKPIVGLNADNFQIVESNKIQKSNLVYTGTNDYSVSIAIILGSNLNSYRNAIQEMAKNVTQTEGNADSFMLIQGGKNPRVLTTGTHDLDEKLDRYQEAQGNDSPEENFDISLRFTLDSLTQLRNKKIIVFISGKSERISADTYNISDLKSYLDLGNASMYSILSSENKIISYLVKNTNGKIYSNANVRNFTSDIQKNRDSLTGQYTLGFTSTAFTDLARRYIPVEAVVRYVRRSGKDELGYFAPLSSANGSR
ncbi:MAG: hypothetical protein AAF975_08380, partial [Spirochaetota bacterium]